MVSILIVAFQGLKTGAREISIHIDDAIFVGATMTSDQAVCHIQRLWI